VDDDDDDDIDADGGEHERDPLSAADFTSRFLQSANRKPVNIYEADFDLTDQLRNQSVPTTTAPATTAPPAPSPVLLHQQTDSQRRPLIDHSTNNLSATTRTHSHSPPGASNSPQPIPPPPTESPNEILSHRAQQQHHYCQPTTLPIHSLSWSRLHRHVLIVSSLSVCCCIYTSCPSKSFFSNSRETSQQ